LRIFQKTSGDNFFLTHTVAYSLRINSLYDNAGAVQRQLLTTQSKLCREMAMVYAILLFAAFSLMCDATSQSPEGSLDEVGNERAK